MTLTGALWEIVYIHYYITIVQAINKTLMPVPTHRRGGCVTHCNSKMAKKYLKTGIGEKNMEHHLLYFNFNQFFNIKDAVA